MHFYGHLGHSYPVQTLLFVLETGRTCQKCPIVKNQNQPITASSTSFQSLRPAACKEVLNPLSLNTVSHSLLPSRFTGGRESGRSRPRRRESPRSQRYSTVLSAANQMVVALQWILTTRSVQSLVMVVERSTTLGYIVCRNQSTYMRSGSTSALASCALEPLWALPTTNIILPCDRCEAVNNGEAGSSTTRQGGAEDDEDEQNEELDDD